MRVLSTAIGAAALLATALTLLAQVNSGKGAFSVIGLGGAGGMYTPAISPFDNKLMLLSCDMSGAYRSLDGGKSWRLIHFKQMCNSAACRPAFTKDAIYWAKGNELKVSRDQGETFNAVGSSQPWKSLTHIGAGRGFLIAGGAEGAWHSTDEGRSWKEIARGVCGGMVVPAETGNVYVAIDDKLLVSEDAAKTWKDLPVGADKGARILEIAGAWTKESGAKAAMLYAVVNKTGIIQSLDGGSTWEAVMKSQGQTEILMPAGQTAIAYSCSNRDVWRTDDGKTWNSIFDMNRNVEKAWVQTQLYWGYSISENGIGIDPSNPDVALVATQGDFYRTADGGKRWFQLQVEPAGTIDGSPAQKTIGLEVTSVWGFEFDPHDPNRQYICYTDIGFARSVDKGQTWSWAAKGCPWRNTFYQIAFDPFVKGRISPATPNRHDIPHWTHVDANKPQHKGGVCVSDDYGARWKVLNTTLPELPCTGIVVDPKSKPDKLTMYATFFEGGVYKTTDGGKTWERKSEGLGNKGNLHSYKVKIHPKTGDLFCVIVAMREGASSFRVPGGIWKSTDGAGTWTDVSASAKFLWPTDFALDPAGENVMYVAAATTPGSNPQGGLWKTVDGGKTYEHVFTDTEIGRWDSPSYDHGMMVKIHPSDSSKVYYGGGHGLWLSKDGGKNWEVFKKFPFRSVQNMTFDPDNRNQIHIATFGAGVFIGTAEPIND